MYDHLDPSVREFLDLYAMKYPQIRFADLDLSVLEAAAEEVAASAAKAAAAESALVLLREQCQAVEGEMMQKVLRALAFLKVYVAGDEPECSRLEAWTQALGSSRSSDKPSGIGTTPRCERKRGRRSKSEPAVNAHFDASESTLVAGDFTDPGLVDPEVATAAAAPPRPQVADGHPRLASASVGG
jgi:hypothetical protein